MISRTAAKRSNDTPLLWLACALVLCAGYYLAFYRLGAAIDRQHDLRNGVATLVRSNDAVLATRVAVSAQARRLDATIAALELSADHATVVARFIRQSADIAVAHHVVLVQIDERTVQSAGRTTESPDAPDFEAVPLDVTLRGSYRDLLATIRALAQAPLAIAIEIATIERAAGPDGSPAGAPLTARLHMSVQRFADEIPAVTSLTQTPEETAHARSF